MGVGLVAVRAAMRGRRQLSTEAEKKSRAASFPSRKKFSVFLSFFSLF
jgi:hypothetical protein